MCNKQNKQKQYVVGGNKFHPTLNSKQTHRVLNKIPSYINKVELTLRLFLGLRS